MIHGHRCGGMHRCGPAWRLRWGMRRRIFVWSGVTILLATVAVLATLHLPAGGGGRIAFALIAAILVLWGAAGALAALLVRPLEDVVRLSCAISDGDLKARLRLPAWHPPHHGTEAQIIAEAVNRMAERIERQLTDQRELLAAVSHELRAPLAHLRLLAERARERGADAKTGAEIEAEVAEIDALVAQLLANARLDFAATDARPLDAVELAVRAVERAGLDPTVLDVEEPAPRPVADPTLLGRAIANLLENGRRHGGGVETFRVRRADGGRVAFEVDDRGPGFAPGEAERAFEPFRSGGQGESLGLGLALVRRIAEAHGGRAYAMSRPDGPGARVGFEVPEATA
jgi:two-component system, OmpR family, sensor kinase